VLLSKHATLGLLAVLLLVPRQGHGAPKVKAANLSASQQQKFLELNLAQPRRCADRVCADDSQGHSWPLTIDASLQRSARRLLAGSRPESGALTAIEIKTGKILTFSEWPTAPSNDRSVLLKQFPAASLFKLVTSAALIEQAHVAPELVVCTHGGVHRLQVENLMPPTDGVAECGPFVEALGFSRNAAFAQLANRYLKPEDLENFADRFGFGSPLPLETRVEFGDFASEVEPLSFAETATGFVGSTLSPLGAAYLAYVIANQGQAGPLTLLDAAHDEPWGTSSRFAALQPQTATQLHRMMELTVRKGTSWRAFHDTRGRPYLPRVSVAGKTGTLGESETTVSWFVGFAPSQHPEIAVSVLLRNGAVWHRKANEVARDWLREYFAQPHEPQTVNRVARVNQRGDDQRSKRDARVADARRTP
jgi:cell division protein FtsI/penicillin-binding protein 2